MGISREFWGRKIDDIVSWYDFKKIENVFFISAKKTYSDEGLNDVSGAKRGCRKFGTHGWGGGRDKHRVVRTKNGRPGGGGEATYGLSAGTKRVREKTDGALLFLDQS